MKSKKIELGCNSYISAEKAVSVIKNRLNGAKAWVAKLSLETFKNSDEVAFKRNWREKSLRRADGKRQSHEVVFMLDGPGVYEFGKFCVSEAKTDWEKRSFFYVDESGEIELIESIEAQLILLEQEFEPPAKTAVNE